MIAFTKKNSYHLYTNAIFCCIVFSKIFNRSSNSPKENLKPIQSRVNVYNPSNSPPQACMFIFSVSETLASEGACVQHENTSLPWYSRVCKFGFLYLMAPTFNKQLIFRYFIYNRKFTHHSRFLDRGGRGAWAIDPSPTLVLYFGLRSSWRFKLPGPDFTNIFINPSNMSAFHRSLKIRIIRPQIELLSLEVLSAIFTLLNVYTFDV